LRFKAWLVVTVEPSFI